MALSNPSSWRMGTLWGCLNLPTWDAYYCIDGFLRTCTTAVQHLLVDGTTIELIPDNEGGQGADPQRSHQRLVPF